MQTYRQRPLPGPDILYLPSEAEGPLETHRTLSDPTSSLRLLPLFVELAGQKPGPLTAW